MKNSLISKTRVFKIYKQEPSGYEYASLFDDTLDSVMVAPLDKEEKLILIKQYLPGVDKTGWIFPGGKVDKDELPELAAKRELIEEVQYGSPDLVRLASVDILPKYLNAQTHLFLATDLYHSEEFQGDEVEKHEIRRFTLDQLLKMIEEGELTDARTVALVLLVATKLGSKVV